MEETIWDKFLAARWLPDLLYVHVSVLGIHLSVEALHRDVSCAEDIYFAVRLQIRSWRTEFKSCRRWR